MSRTSGVGSQVALLVAVNGMVGATLGQERTVVPLLGQQVFGLEAFSAALSFILAFGVAKAATNYVAGAWADRYGRKPVLVAGWLVAVPVPLILIWAPGWWWVIAANVLLGISQGLTWSMTVVMKVDLVSLRRRGLAMGLNQAAGYSSVAVAAVVTGYLAEDFGLRPAPFLFGLAVAALGLGLSALTVRETRHLAHASIHDHEVRADRRTHLHGDLSGREIFVQTSIREPTLSAACQAGLVKNLNDGMAWGLFPVLFASAGMSIGAVGILVAVYPAVWGLGQLVTGPLSDRVGRKPLITWGMWVQGAGLLAVASGDGLLAWAVGAAVLGVGSAMSYPTLLAAVGDVAHPAWRGRALGVYRLWRDGGFAVGAVVSGLLADQIGLRGTIGAVAALTVFSGVVVALRMRESLAQPASGVLPDGPQENGDLRTDRGSMDG